MRTLTIALSAAAITVGLLSASFAATPNSAPVTPDNVKGGKSGCARIEKKIEQIQSRIAEVEPRVNEKGTPEIKAQFAEGKALIVKAKGEADAGNCDAAIKDLQAAKVIREKMRSEMQALHGEGRK